MVLWAGRVDLLAEAGCSRMASFTCLRAQMRWLGWLRPLSTLSHPSESCPDLFTWWWKFSQQQERASSKAESTCQASVCIMFANVPPTNRSYMTKPSFKGWRNRCHLFMAGAVKYCGHVFSQSTKGSNPKSSESKSSKFPWVLKPGFENIPQRQTSEW